MKWFLYDGYFIDVAYGVFTGNFEHIQDNNQLHINLMFLRLTLNMYLLAEM